MKELNYIQTKLVSDKDQRNSFGNYQYRTLDGILNALKPLLLETGCTINISDEIILIGARYYVRATATIENTEGVKVTSTAYAREQEAKKGQDEAQITGTSSTYARKYAVSALLGISDGYDPDLANGSEADETTIEEVMAKIDTLKTKAELDKFYRKYEAKFGNNNDFVAKINWKFQTLTK